MSGEADAVSVNAHQLVESVFEGVGRRCVHVKHVVEVGSSLPPL